MIIEVEQAASGKVKTPGSLFKLSKTPGNIKFPAPSLGEHNLEVYSSMLGYTEQEITQLAGPHQVGDRPHGFLHPRTVAFHGLGNLLLQAFLMHRGA